MTINDIILTLILVTPLIGAILLALLPDRGKIQQWAALVITLITFALTLHLPAHFSSTAQSGAFQFEQNHAWISSPAIHYHIGVDAISMWLVVLTGLLAPLGVLISWRAIDSRKKLFYTLLLLQQVAMYGIFISLDLFLYYGFWELSLVPMTLLIATAGRTESRQRAAIKYFLYAFIPSALLLVAIVWLYTRTGTFDLPTLTALAAQHGISTSSSALWLASVAFLFAFAVKVPVFPLHGWLVDAVMEAPTAAVIVLTGKTALYSILRFSFAIFPAESRRIAPLMIALAAIGVVYAALLALVQRDMKKLAAYATLSALSFIVLGFFTFTASGLTGGAYQILNESLAGAALFMLLGLLYERYRTYDMRDYGGLAAQTPWIVTMFVITGLTLVGLPMLSSFVGEFLILSSSIKAAVPHRHLWTALATTGVILSAAYMLTMIQRVFYADAGPRPASIPPRDLDAREHLALWPLAILFLVMGLASPYWTRTIGPAVTALAAGPTSTPASPDAAPAPSATTTASTQTISGGAR
ncbi:MAG TPA: NADH-quinone oxidoreductase subunit M [Acidobacteriaceae bacterium]|nr:NADH-quinone oxidoreductase subunit M [Acidobacteriaceae bacterium]